MILKNFVVWTLIISILAIEYNFAIWLQSIINSAIPKGEWYNFVHIVTIVLHVIVLGSTYLAVAIYSAIGLFALFNKNN